MKRLNQERQERLEPERMKRALEAIGALGYTVNQVSDVALTFEHKPGQVVKYFPYSGWATGRSIKDGRGLQKLLKQIRK